MSSVHIGDTGLFVAMGNPSNSRYRVVRRYARRNGIRILLPERVYEELSVDGSATRTPPVETAIDEGWVTVAPSLDFTRPIVSRTMDGVQRYIANEDGRQADEIERADAALAALAVQKLDSGATEAYVYTTDIAAGEAAETILASEGYGNSITFVNGFRLIEDLQSADE